MITSKVILDSVSSEGIRLTTLELEYPRFIHSEFMTHRVFSRNASSSRAIPLEKQARMVAENPAMPIHWGKNQKGMQANEEIDAEQRKEAKQVWREARLNAIYGLGRNRTFPVFTSDYCLDAVASCYRLDGG